MESVGAFACGEMMDSFAVSELLDHSLFHGGHEHGFSPCLEAENGVVAEAVDESLVCSVTNPETNLSIVSQRCFLPGFNQMIPCGHDDVFLPTDMFMGIADPHVAAMCSDHVGVKETEGLCGDRDASFVVANALSLAREMPMKRMFDVVDPSENMATHKRIRVPRDVGSGGQSSSSYSSEEENPGQETKPCLAMNSNGKARAARGGATDPQSLYARKRREKINERLRTLQKLVPNGTKVDISTMLEEAVHYVKFLQLQIKLLSSDDLWMYAPLAYNGFDMDLHMKIFSQFSR